MIDLNYNGHLSIAQVYRRTQKSWRNQDMLWSEFLDRIAETRRTDETVKQYRELPKATQDSIKDVGGFFGGYLTGGKRSNDTILYRQLITLDIDDGIKDLWGLFTILYGNAAAMYTTHKHTARNPRYRLMVPLKEAVTSDEYEAIARKIASDIGIDYFDDTSFQPARFMYWPSTSKDGEYLFEYQDGEWMDGKKMLAEAYHNWKDRSEWPYSSRVPKVVKESSKKQGDPNEKPGLVGLFCRAYDIYSAIDSYSPDVYKSEGHDRYTYTAGTTSCGLVIYEGGKFAYSNHSTDPAGGHLCNAFDLVRLHLYGERDDRERTYAKPSDMPSFALMEELCQKDETVKKLRATEKVAEVSNDFGDLDLDGKDLEDMLSRLDADKKGNFLPTLENIKKILRNDQRLSQVKFDVFSQRSIVPKPLPWNKDDNYVAYPRDWTDSDDSSLRCYLEAAPYGIKTSKNNISDAMESFVSSEKPFHPVREYLDNLTWDGTERLDTLFIDYLGAEDTGLNREMTRKAFTAAVARIYKPGYKFDYVATIIGTEGKGKSTILAKMGGKWFSDSLIGIDGVRAMEQIQGKWIIEFSDLSSLDKAHVEQIKAFISKTSDGFRPAYGRRTQTVERQCVFFATTNVSNFLRGTSGNRRFWPIETDITKTSKNVFTDLDGERDQIWAEAKYRYENNEPLYLQKSSETLARNIQEEHNENAELKNKIIEYLETRLPSDWKDMSADERQSYFMNCGSSFTPTGTLKRETITTTEILNECMFMKIGTPEARLMARTLHGIMVSLPNWERYRSKDHKLKISGGAYGVAPLITYVRINTECDTNPILGGGYDI